MDVKFINPFVQGTVEAMKKIAARDVQPGKMYLKESNVAAGDVSGIVGITGDATGSLVISFTETCICAIVGGMRGEQRTAADREVFAAVREITAMILAIAVTEMEKAGLKIYAALPTVVSGKGHTIEPLEDSPSITIPFATEKETFGIDICIKSMAQEGVKSLNKPVVKLQQPDPPITTADSGINRAAEPAPAEMDRRTHLIRQLTEAKAARDHMVKQLAEKPFMEISQRVKFKKMLPALEAKIKRLKLDITALEVMAKVNSDSLENPTIPRDYQHYDNSRKR